LSNCSQVRVFRLPTELTRILTSIELTTYDDECLTNAQGFGAFLRRCPNLRSINCYNHPGLMCRVFAQFSKPVLSVRSLSFEGSYWNPWEELIREEEMRGIIHALPALEKMRLRNTPLTEGGRRVWESSVLKSAELIMLEDSVEHRCN